MLNSTIFFHYPGGENENAASTSFSTENQHTSNSPNDESNPDQKEHKTVIEKIKEALQDWSDKDERDQAFDDTRV